MHSSLRGSRPTADSVFNGEGQCLVNEIVDHYDAIVRKLDRAPIIMGHSFGGLFTQILLDRGLGAAGVAIDSAPVKDVVILPFSELKVGWPVLRNPANVRKAMQPTPEQFHYSFGNLLSEEESRAVYDRYAVPGPDHALFQASLANFNPHAATAVNFHNDTRAPPLLIAGGKDLGRGESRRLRPEGAVRRNGSRGNNRLTLGTLAPPGRGGARSFRRRSRLDR